MADGEPRGLPAHLRALLDDEDGEMGDAITRALEEIFETFYERKGVARASRP